MKSWVLFLRFCFERGVCWSLFSWSESFIVKSDSLSASLENCKNSPFSESFWYAGKLSLVFRCFGRFAAAPDIVRRVLALILKLLAVVPTLDKKLPERKQDIDYIQRGLLSKMMLRIEIVESNGVSRLTR